jgi:hypothetical protein
MFRTNIMLPTVERNELRIFQIFLGTNICTGTSHSLQIAFLGFPPSLLPLVGLSAGRTATEKLGL